MDPLQQARQERAEWLLKRLEQMRRAASEHANRGERVIASKRIGELTPMTPEGEGDFIFEVVEAGRQPYWQVFCGGRGTLEAYADADQAMIAWIDARKNGITSQAHKWAYTILDNPV